MFRPAHPALLRRDDPAYADYREALDELRNILKRIIKRRDTPDGMAMAFKSFGEASDFLAANGIKIGKMKVSHLAGEGQDSLIAQFPDCETGQLKEMITLFLGECERQEIKLSGTLSGSLDYTERHMDDEYLSVVKQVRPLFRAIMLRVTGEGNVEVTLKAAVEFLKLQGIHVEKSKLKGLMQENPYDYCYKYPNITIEVMRELPRIFAGFGERAVMDGINSDIQLAGRFVEAVMDEQIQIASVNESGVAAMQDISVSPA